MSESDPFRLYVVHEFAENQEYSRVFEYLETRDNFFYRNHSSIEAVPANSSMDVLQEALRMQLKECEVVIVPAGMLANASKLIEFQLTAAQAFKKPIILIQPFGGTMSIPKSALDIAAEVVGWNEREIIEAIRRAARGEDTAEWDVIEFDPDEFKTDE